MSNATPTMHSPLVCVVDADAAVRESVEDLIREEGFHVDSFDSAEGFLGRTRVDPPACLILDHVLPGMSGLELHEELTRSGLDAPTILMTGRGDVSTSVRAIKAGAVDVLTKPYDDDDRGGSPRRGPLGSWERATRCRPCCNRSNWWRTPTPRS